MMLELKSYIYIYIIAGEEWLITHQSLGDRHIRGWIIAKRPHCLRCCCSDAILLAKLRVGEINESYEHEEKCMCIYNILIYSWLISSNNFKNLGSVGKVLSLIIYNNTYYLENLQGCVSGNAKKKEQQGTTATGWAASIHICHIKLQEDTSSFRLQSLAATILGGDFRSNRNFWGEKLVIF